MAFRQFFLTARSFLHGAVEASHDSVAECAGVKLFSHVLVLNGPALAYHEVRPRSS